MAEKRPSLQCFCYSTFVTEVSERHTEPPPPPPRPNSSDTASTASLHDSDIHTTHGKIWAWWNWKPLSGHGNAEGLTRRARM